MMFPLLHIDAFTRWIFGGNPAAVVPLPRWLPDATLQALAAENNLPETAFLVGERGQYHLRWFTPTQEVNFCGHATLASAWALWERRGETATTLRFQTRVGELRATRGTDGEVVLDFPRLDPVLSAVRPADLEAMLGVPVLEVFAPSGGTMSLFAVLESAQVVQGLIPDFVRLGNIDDLVVTAAGDGSEGAPDFVSRCFAPGMGIPEDPVTGSTHSTLAPYWAARLGREHLLARQLSARGGELHCEVGPERVHVSGHAVLYSEGTVHVPDGEA